MNIAQANDLVLLIGPDEHRFLIKLTAGQQHHTHDGFILHNDMIGQPYGCSVKTQLGYPYLLLQPSTYDLGMHVKRSSQIIYPKEIGYILLRMNIIPGARVVEAGTGSGGLTMALARFVRPDGRIYTYEERDDMIAMARKNLERAGVLDAVELKQRDIREGFDERDADALFLDVREPWLFLAQAHAALKGGGFFGSLVPTTNQLSEILQEMETLGSWTDIEVIEIFMRRFKPNAERLRPEDRMIAHTGYLLFARAIVKMPERVELAEEKLNPEVAMAKDELVVVFTTQGALRAEVIKSKLESAGIPAMIRSEAQSVLPMTVDGIGTAEVLVEKAREQEARQVLEI